MKIRSDGSIQPSSIPTFENENKKYDDAIYRCMVTGVNFVGDRNSTKNASNARVLYEVVVLGGFASGQLLTDCRLASDLGGNENYHEIVLTPSTKNLVKDSMVDHDGDVVYVQFIQGDTNFPVIVGMDVGYDTKTKIGATESDGIREIRQFNGVKEEITKTGEFTITRQGGSVKEEVFVADEGTPRYKEEFKDPELLIRTFKSGMIIKEDGENDKVTVTTKSGAVLTIDGKTDKITLSSGFVDLGAAISDLVALGTELITAHNTHIHDCPQSPSGVLPSLPPAPMPPTVLSNTVKLAP